MKYKVGDEILVLHSNEEGIIIDIMNDKMVMIEVRGVKFPAYMDQIDFPYYKRFTEKKLFQEKSIVDLDLRTSGISHGKKSFFNLEINLYTNSEMDFKSVEIKDSIKTIVKSIFRNNIQQNKYFEFSTSKKTDDQ